MRPTISHDDITLPYQDATPSTVDIPPAKKHKNNTTKMPPQTVKEDVDLSHQEIWDDSALIDAWDFAQAEYAPHNGGDKDGWKNKPVKKSTLWHNTASESFTSKPTASHAHQGSNPIDSNTFVPSHDASLHLPAPSGVPGPDYSTYFLPEPQGPMVSQDEAFRHALGAMYWGGYWTAMYHFQRSQAGDGQPFQVLEKGNHEEDCEDETQR